jgi:hypothetical protein
MHGSLVTSSLIRETTENESANEGYRFGQEEETYNIVAVEFEAKNGEKLRILRTTNLVIVEEAQLQFLFLPNYGNNSRRIIWSPKLSYLYNNTNSLFLFFASTTNIAIRY